MALIITSNTSNATQHMMTHHKDHSLTISIQEVRDKTNRKRKSNHNQAEG